MSKGVLILPPGKDIFASPCDAIVIPTNAIGTQGAGLAKLAAQRCPNWSLAYKRWCAEAHPEAGDALVTEFTDPPGQRRVHRWYVAVLTKNHWREPSELPWIEKGLRELEVALASEPDLRSFAIPALGCGEHTGQLPWDKVRPLILATAERLVARGLGVEVYEPWASEPPRRSPSRGRR